MTRKNKHKRQDDSVLESVFGIKLDAGAGDGDSPANPKPEVDPAVAAAVPHPDPEVEARIVAREKAAHMAEIRNAAVQVAVKAGVQQRRAPALVKLIDLTGVGVNSDGEPDTAELEQRVHAGIQEYPELEGHSQQDRLDRLYRNAPRASLRGTGSDPSFRVGG